MESTRSLQRGGSSSIRSGLRSGQTIVRPNLTEPDNQEVYHAVTALAAERFLGGSRGIRFGPLVVNDWSFCIELRTSVQGKTGGIYVKIPKDEIERKRILPITQGAARLAGDEYASLKNLAENWSADDLAVYFVHPLALFDEYNAIVTQRVEGKPFLDRFRHRDIRRRFRFCQQDDEVHDAMGRLGRALSRFHGKTGRVASWRGDQFAVKLRRIAAELAEMGLPDDASDRLEPTFAAIERTHGDGTMADTLKGLDVRNVLFEDGKIFLLDPGKIKAEFRQADVARFVMTCRILWWGNPLFFMDFVPDASYEKEFLAGYHGPASSETVLLSLHLLKELLKTWRMAYRALDGKHWPALFKKAVQRGYIDPFFKRQLATEILPWQ